MDLVRHLTLLTLRYNFYLKVQHIEGKRNDIADSLSRFQMEKFRLLAPHADPAPCQVHQVLWEIDLDADISHYLNLSIAASTRQTYSSAEKRFVDFCSLYCPGSGSCLSVDKDTLIQYVAFLAKFIKHSSGYLAAVHLFHARHGFALDLNKFLLLQLVCRSIKRSQGAGSKRVRLPISIQHLRFFYSHLAIPYTPNFDSVILWAAMTLAFFGFLRLGELICNSTFSPDTHLSLGDVTFLPSWDNPDYMSVRINISKTGPFRRGQTITIGKTNKPVCPVKAMKAYISVRTTTSGPLFIFTSG